MARFKGLRRRSGKHWIIRFSIIMLAGNFCFQVLAATQSRKMPAVAKWGLFAHTFRSSVSYSNALLQTTLTVTFSSPTGEKRGVQGFWDGGRNWRVRFAPDQSGVWTFTSTCSDENNRGLNHQSGEFVCTAAAKNGLFSEHGPVNVARDHYHLEHADGTPFFWLADTVWNGPRTATADEWELYAGVRADQKFTVAIWSPGGLGSPNQAAFSRTSTQIFVNPGFFQKLDARLETLTRSGILSAIAPLMDLAENSVSDDEAVAMMRYALARWGAEPVVWVLPFENPASADRVARLNRIGSAVFSQLPHAPVMLAVKGAAAVPQEMQSETWLGMLSFESKPGLLDHPQTDLWRKEPERPIIFSTAVENTIAAQGGKRVRADEVRQSAYGHLLVVPTAGISYGARGVADWDSKASGDGGQTLPMWHRALFMPGAKEMSLAAAFFESHDFWRLRPLPRLLVARPDESHQGFVVAAGTEGKDLVMAYSSAMHSIDLLLEGMPVSPAVSWFNPRTGKSSSGVAVVSGSACQFPTPDPGDWVLVLKSR